MSQAAPDYHGQIESSRSESRNASTHARPVVGWQSGSTDNDQLGVYQDQQALTRGQCTGVTLITRNTCVC